ncbi:hypothetical protein P7K49_014772, partial [Saguinus oedipus]
IHADNLQILQAQSDKTKVIVLSPKHPFFPSVPPPLTQSPHLKHQHNFDSFLSSMTR